MRGLLLILVGFLLTNCLGTQRTISLNHFPEFGNVKKDIYEDRADFIFLEDMKTQFSTMKEASEALSTRGWSYFVYGDHERAMFRFNQAWLCDSTNPEAYWGFAVLESVKGRFESSKHYFEKSHRFKNVHPHFYKDWAEMNLVKYKSTDSLDYVFLADSIVNMGLQIDTTNARLFHQKAWTSYYKKDFEIAKINFEKAESINVNVVDKELKKLILYSLKTRKEEE